MKFTAFPSIEGFHNVVKMVDNYPELNPGPLVYRGKIKLDGTNSAVRVNKDGTVVAQSRNRDITPEDDNAGFAKWVEVNKDYFSGLSCLLKGNAEYIVVFGEWCGQGIMKRAAISKIPGKIFAVFGIFFEEDGWFVVEPVQISELLNRTQEVPSDVKILPWHDSCFDVDFSRRDNLADVAENCSKLIDQIEACDPWVKQEFGVDGVAEGIVYYPFSLANAESFYLDFFGRYSFKAKGLKHQATKSKEAVQVDPEVLNSINNFVEFFMTEGRVEQGISVVGLDIKNTGKFLQWMLTDVEKESSDELEASGLTWDEVKGAVGQEARKKYIAECKKI